MVRRVPFVEAAPQPVEVGSDADLCAADDGHFTRRGNADTDVEILVAGAHGITFRLQLVPAAQRAVELNTPPLLPPCPGFEPGCEGWWMREPLYLRWHGGCLERRSRPGEGWTACLAAGGIECVMHLLPDDLLPFKFPPDRPGRPDLIEPERKWWLEVVRLSAYLLRERYPGLGDGFSNAGNGGFEPYPMDPGTPPLCPGADGEAWAWTYDPGHDVPWSTRARCEGEAVVGAAHLWVGHLPARDVVRLSMLNMRWRQAMPSLIRHRNEMVGLWSYGFDASGPLPLEAALATANAVVAADLGYEPYSQPSPPLTHDSDDSDLEREAGAMEAGAVMSGRLALTGMRCDYDDDGYLDLALAAPNAPTPRLPHTPPSALSPPMAPVSSPLLSPPPSSWPSDSRRRFVPHSPAAATAIAGLAARRLQNGALPLDSWEIHGIAGAADAAAADRRSRGAEEPATIAALRAKPAGDAVELEQQRAMRESDAAATSPAPPALRPSAPAFVPGSQWAP